MTILSERQAPTPAALPLQQPLDQQEAEVSCPGGSLDAATDLLLKVVPGDPLGVRTQVARRLRERCLLLDPHGVSVLVLASIATQHPIKELRQVKVGTGASEMGVRNLVQSTVDQVIDDCVAGRLEVPVAGFSRGGILSQLARVLKISQVELNRACDRFNRMPAEARRAFHALVLQRRTLESACRRSASVAELWSEGATRGLRDIVGARKEPNDPGDHALSGQGLS
ncbi:MAG: hypothetical protein ACI9X4_001963 [Glaciecola sp.]|jgi:hypothetical protein